MEGGTQKCSWPGVTLHRTQPLSALSTNLCLPLAGRELPPPTEPLPGSPVFLGVSLLQRGSVSLSNNPNVDPFLKAITQMALQLCHPGSRAVPTTAAQDAGRLAPPPGDAAQPGSPCAALALTVLGARSPFPPLFLSAPSSGSSSAAALPALASSSFCSFGDTNKGLWFHPLLCAAFCLAAGTAEGAAPALLRDRCHEGCWGHGLLPGPSACAPAAAPGDGSHVLLGDSPFRGPHPSSKTGDCSQRHKELGSPARGTKGNPGQASSYLCCGQRWSLLCLFIHQASPWPAASHGQRLCLRFAGSPRPPPAALPPHRQASSPEPLGKAMSGLRYHMPGLVRCPGGGSCSPRGSTRAGVEWLTAVSGRRRGRFSRTGSSLPAVLALPARCPAVLMVSACCGLCPCGPGGHVCWHGTSQRLRWLF